MLALAHDVNALRAPARARARHDEHVARTEHNADADKNSRRGFLLVPRYLELGRRLLNERRRRENQDVRGEVASDSPHQNKGGIAPGSTGSNNIGAVPCNGTPEQCRQRAMDFNLGGGIVPGGVIVGRGGSLLGRLFVWLFGKGAASTLGGPFAQRTIGSFILQSRSGLLGRTFVHEIKVLANASAKEATRADFAYLANTLVGEARAAGAAAVEIRGVSVINPGILRLRGLAKELGFTVKEVGSDFITFVKAL